nr:MAG: hypothetical protein [Wufeng shrew rhabdovirus 2]
MIRGISHSVKDLIHYWGSCSCRYNSIMAFKLDKNKKEMNELGLTEDSFAIDQTHGLEIMKKEEEFGEKTYTSVLTKPILLPKVITEAPKPVIREDKKVEDEIKGISASLPYLTKADFEMLKMKASNDPGSSTSFINGFLFGALCTERAIRRASQDSLQGSMETLITQLRKELKKIVDVSDTVVKASESLPKSISKLSETQVKLDITNEDLTFAARELTSEIKKITLMTTKREQYA